MSDRQASTHGAVLVAGSLAFPNTRSYHAGMGDRPLTSHDAERIRREWAAGRADLDDVTRALDQLVHTMGVVDRARRLIARAASGPWPGVRQAVTGMEEWLADTAPDPIKPAAAPRRR